MHPHYLLLTGNAPHSSVSFIFYGLAFLVCSLLHQLPTSRFSYGTSDLELLGQGGTLVSSGRVYRASAMQPLGRATHITYMYANATHDFARHPTKLQLMSMCSSNSAVLSYTRLNFPDQQLATIRIRLRMEQQVRFTMESLHRLELTRTPPTVADSSYMTRPSLVVPVGGVLRAFSLPRWSAIIQSWVE